jgi:flavin reductase (DIM6/NTAB) family NADH-FMN oxidoreductase RutF
MSKSESNINREALKSLGYGMYIVTSRMDEKINGQVANTVFQVTSEPPQIATAISKANLTHEYILKSSVFAVNSLAESAPMDFFGPMGFRSGRVIDKFEAAPYKTGKNGCPILTENVVAAIEVKVVHQVDIGTHTLFIGEVTSTETMSDAPPMSYKFYREHIKGMTPVDSPTHIPSEK